MVRQVRKWSLPMLVLAAALTGYWGGAAAAGAVLAGGVTGLLHLAGVEITAQTVARGIGASGIMLFLSIFRLALVGLVLYLLVKHAGLHPVGLLAGFGIVHVLILITGWRDAARQQKATGATEDA